MKWDKFIIKEKAQVAARQSRIDEYQKSALEKADEIARYFVREYNVSQVVLFGSILSDRFSMDSDIDMAVRGLAPENYFRACIEAEEIAKPYKLDITDLNQEPSFWRFVRGGKMIYGGKT